MLSFAVNYNSAGLLWVLPRGAGHQHPPGLPTRDGPWLPLLGSEPGWGHNGRADSRDPTCVMKRAWGTPKKLVSLPASPALQLPVLAADLSPAAGRLSL